MKIRNPSLSKQTASSLGIVLTVMATLIIIVAIAADYTSHVNRNVRRSNNYESALAIADSSIEILFANWRNTCSNPPSQAITVKNTSDFSAVPTPSPGEFPNLPGNSITGTFVKRGTSPDPASDEWDGNYTISNYKVVATTPEWGGYATTTASPTPGIGQSNSTLTYNYIASADVTLPNLDGKQIVARVQRVFQKEQMSPWNFAIFYVDPLEIHPGPPSTVTGWVHTNVNLYTAHNTLTFADKVTYGSDWFIGFMPGETTHSGETPASPNYPSGLPPARDQALQPFGLDSTLVFSTDDANPNNDSYRELVEPPVTTFSDPLAGERYWDQASVIIRINSDNTYTIGYPGGLNYAFTSVSGADWRYTMFHPTGVIITNQVIQDNREGAQIRLATLDVSQIVTSVPNGNPNYTNANFTNTPIIYIYDSSASASARRGIRIKGASKIPTAGLTVVSNNPVYVQGDFNTGGTGTIVPSNNPSNLNSNGTYLNPANPPAPQVPGYTRAPSSILADSVNILSDNWTDANSRASLSQRPASATTINVGIASGIVPSNVYNDGGYSGGAENFPRLLEDWTNKPLTYYGSMLELFRYDALHPAQQAIGEWHYGGNIYDAPAREWFFDNNFKINPPPGSLMLCSYVKGKWTVR